MSEVITTAGPSEETWAVCRALITRLYQTEARPLKEVIGLLEEDGFRASEKMYKSRIRKWKIDKKRKRPEMLFALRTIESRRQQGKSTDITIRSHPVTEGEVRRYFARQKTSVTDDAIAYERASTPPELEYGTPTMQHAAIARITSNSGSREAPLGPPRCQHSVRLARTTQLSDSQPTSFALKVAADASWPLDPRAPKLRAVRSIESSTFRGLKLMQQFRQPQMRKLIGSVEPLSYAAYGFENEICSSMIGPSNPTTESTLSGEALRLVADYYTRYYFESNKWLRFANHMVIAEHFDARSAVLERDEALYANLYDPGKMTSAIEVAIGLFGRGEVESAGSLLESACASIEALVVEQHPQLLACLLKSLSLVCTTRYLEVNQVLLRHLHDIACLLLRENHPLVRLSSVLARGIINDGNLADRALEVLTDVFSAHAGPLHPTTLHVLYTYAWSALRRNDTAQAQRILRYLQDIYEENTSLDSIESRKILYALAQLHLIQGETALAREVLEEHQKRTERRFGAGTPVESKIEALRVRALFCMKMSDFEEMYILRKQAYELGKQLLTDEHPTMALLAGDLKRHD